MANIKKRNKRMLLLFVLLFIVFLSLNSRTVWKFMYPIKYENLIQTYSDDFQIDPFLVLAIIQVETRFEEGKKSGKGAIGLMQIMPETANWIASKAGFSEDLVTELEKPEVNIKFGSWYIQQVTHQFNNNLYPAIAAYNAGPGNVEKWMRDGIWDGTIEHIDQIPFGETRHYVQRVLHFYERYQWIYENDFS